MLTTELSDLPVKKSQGLFQVAIIMPKALPTKIVGHTMVYYGLQALLQLGLISLNIPQGNHKTVLPMAATFQLFAMTLTPEDAYTFGQFSCP